MNKPNSIFPMHKICIPLNTFMNKYGKYKNVFISAQCILFKLNLEKSQRIFQNSTTEYSDAFLANIKYWIS